MKCGVRPESHVLLIFVHVLDHLESEEDRLISFEWKVCGASLKTEEDTRELLYKASLSPDFLDLSDDHPGSVASPKTLRVLYVDTTNPSQWARQVHLFSIHLDPLTMQQLPVCASWLSDLQKEMSVADELWKLEARRISMRAWYHKHVNVIVGAAFSALNVHNNPRKAGECEYFKTNSAYKFDISQIPTSSRSN